MTLCDILCHVIARKCHNMTFSLLKKVDYFKLSDKRQNFELETMSTNEIFFHMLATYAFLQYERFERYEYEENIFRKLFENDDIGLIIAIIMRNF